jgi:tetratricopeptide (TPR) repeat protein
MLPIVCLLGLFLLSMSGGQIYATDEGSEENLETSDAIQQQQDSPIDYTFRGNSLLKKGQIDDAITDLNKAIDLNPKDAGAHFYRGNAYYKKGQIDKALSDYSKAIKINSRYTNAYFSRGLHYVGVEEYSKAISDYKKPWSSIRLLLPLNNYWRRPSLIVIFMNSACVTLRG